MTPRQLRYFVTIAQCGSITTAAAQLHVAQPALSHHLAALEEELGIAVFVRHARGVHLTPAGQRLLERATAILRQLERLPDDVHAASEEPRGPVALCVVGSLAPLLAAPLFRTLLAEAPDLQLQLSTAISFEARALVEARKVDLAILPTAFEMPHLEVIPLFEERFQVIGPPPLLGHDALPLSMRELASLPLIAPDRNHDLRRLLERAALDQGLSLNVRIEVNDASLLRSLVRANLGCAVMPHSGFPQHPDHPLVSRPIVEPELLRTQSLVWLDDRPLTPAGRRVADTLRTLIGTMMTDGRLHARPL